MNRGIVSSGFALAIAAGLLCGVFVAAVATTGEVAADEPAAFEVELEEEATEIRVDDPLSVEATITNDGADFDIQDVEFVLESSNETEAVPLESGESTTVTFEREDPDLEPGTYTYGVRTENESDTGTVTVLEPASFDLEIHDTAAEAGTTDVDVAIENEGEVAADRTISLAANDTPIEERDVTLEGGEVIEETFSFEPDSLPIDVTAAVADDFDDAVTAAADPDNASIDNATVESPEIEHGPRVEDVEPEFVLIDETVTVTYTAEGPNVDTVHLIVEDPDGDVVINDTLEQGTDADWTIAASGLEEGPYDVTVAVVDAFGGIEADTLESAFVVSTVYDPDDGDIGQEVYRTPAGDRVQIDVSLDGIDEGYLLVGGDNLPNDDVLQNYFDILYVDGDATFTVNTRLVGTDRPSGAVYTVEDGTVISYAHGTPDGAETHPEETDVFEDVRFVDEDDEVVAETLAEFRAEIGVESLPRPLQPGRYRLVLGAEGTVVVDDDGVPHPRHALDRSNMLLDDPEFGEVTTYRLPPIDEEDEAPGEIDDIGDLLGEATEDEPLVPGDRLLIEVDGITGLYGAMLDSAREPGVLDADADPDGIHPDGLVRLLERHEGINLTVTHTNPQRINMNRMEEPIEFDLESATAEDLYLLPDPNGEGDEPSIERFYIVVDTRGAAPFDRPLEGGERFDVELAYESPPGEQYRFPETDVAEKPPAFDPANEPAEDGTEHYPYFDEADTTVSTETTFEIEDPDDPFVEYLQTTADGNPIVVAAETVTISGESNLFPETDVTVQIVSEEARDPTEITVEDVDIDEDGSFSFDVDLSMVEPEDDLEIELYTYERLYDKRPLVVVEELEDFTTFEIAELETTSTVDDGERRNVATATIENTGYVNETAEVELRLDGEPLAERDTEIVVDETATVEFEAALADLDPGEHTVTVRTQDDEEHELLVVPGEYANFDIAAVDVESPIGEDEGPPEISAMVDNTGTIDESATVELRFEDEQLAERVREIDAGGRATFYFDDVAPDPDPGEYTVAVRTQDDVERETLVVEERVAVFEIETFSVESPIESGESPEPWTTIENTGNVSGTATVELRLDDETVEEREVALEAGETATLDLRDAIAALEAGEYTVELHTPDDEATREIVVGDTVAEDPTPEPEDDGVFDGIAVPPGIGVGTRHAVGGTVVVGVVYVLGYWV